MPEFDATLLKRDFGDWQAEAVACRRECALFDFSFMSRVQVSGEGALQTLDAFQNRRVGDMPINRIRYGLRVDKADRVVADLTLWRRAHDCFEVMSGRYTDIADLLAMETGGRAAAVLPTGDISCTDLSADTAIFAVQGPATLAALESLTDIRALSALDYYGFESIELAGIPCLIGRLGYTGERGIEIIAPRAEHARLWTALATRARPAGFAAIDSLRIEAGFMLFANDLVLGPTISELGVGPGTIAGTDADRFEFICCTAKATGDPVMWQPAEMNPQPPTDNEIVITSACWSMVAQSVLVLGFTRRDADPLQPLIDPAGEFSHFKRVSRPFVDPLKKRPRGEFSRDCR